MRWKKIFSAEAIKIQTLYNLDFLFLFLYLIQLHKPLIKIKIKKGKQTERQHKFPKSINRYAGALQKTEISHGVNLPGIIR